MSECLSYRPTVWYYRNIFRDYTKLSAVELAAYGLLLADELEDLKAWVRGLTREDLMRASASGGLIPPKFHRTPAEMADYPETFSNLSSGSFSDDQDLEAEICEFCIQPEDHVPQSLRKC